MLDAATVNAVVNHSPDQALLALAEPTRRAVIELLAEGPLRASDIADSLGTSRAAMSRHLRTLRSAGLLTVELSETDARERTYSLRADELVALRAWVDQVQAGWQHQLDSFAAHVGRTRTEDDR
jgi:DNA-binding transcriptional ArsR family regulator